MGEGGSVNTGEVGDSRASYWDHSGCFQHPRPMILEPKGTNTKPRDDGAEIDSDYGKMGDAIGTPGSLCVTIDSCKGPPTYAPTS